MGSCCGWSTATSWELHSLLRQHGASRGASASDSRWDRAVVPLRWGARLWVFLLRHLALFSQTANQGVFIFTDECFQILLKWILHERVLVSVE